MGHSGDMGHSHSHSPQTPGTHRSRVGARAPQGRQLPIPNEPQGPRVLGQAAPPGPCSLGGSVPSRHEHLFGVGRNVFSLFPTHPGPSAAQVPRIQREPELLSQHNVTWDLSLGAIALTVEMSLLEEGRAVTSVFMASEATPPPALGRNNGFN